MRKLIKRTVVTETYEDQDEPTPDIDDVEPDDVEEDDAEPEDEEDDTKVTVPPRRRRR